MVELNNVSAPFYVFGHVDLASIKQKTLLRIPFLKSLLKARRSQVMDLLKCLSDFTVFVGAFANAPKQQLVCN